MKIIKNSDNTNSSHYPGSCICIVTKRVIRLRDGEIVVDEPIENRITFSKERIDKISQDAGVHDEDES